MKNKINKLFINGKKLNESKSTKKYLKESGVDVLYNLIDRAKSYVDDGYDLDDAINTAIDDGLIYTSDVLDLAQKYGVVNDSELIGLFYDDLYNDMYGDLEDYANEEVESTYYITDIEWDIEDELDDDQTYDDFVKENNLPRDFDITVTYTRDDDRDLDEIIGDAISDEYGYTHNGFKFNKLNESLKEGKSEIVDTLYDVNTLDYENDKLYKKNIEHYDTYADYDEAFETYKKLSHESFYPHVELCQVDVYEDGHRDYKVLKSTYGNELVEDTDTIKIKPTSKNIEIDIEDDEDDLGHPIKKGLGDDTKKVIKEDKQSYRQDLIAKYNKDIEDDTKALEVARREREKDSKHATYFDKIIRDLELSIEYAKEQIEKLSSNEPKDKEFDIDALNSNTKRSALRYRNEENRKELERADVIKPSLLKVDEQAYKNFVKAAEKATEMSPLGYIYVVKDTYLDFFANWQWTTLVAYTRNSKIGDSYQALNQQEWEMIANAKSDVEIDKALDSMFNDRLNPDQESKRKRDNLEDVMWKLSDLED